MCTPKQRKFVSEYLIDLNATQAAIRAGYSKKNADKIGSQLLGKTRVAEAITKRQSQLAQKAEITQEKVAAEYAKLAFSNMLDYITVGADGYAYIDLSKLNRDQASAIQEITVDEYVDGRGEDAREVKKVKLKLTDKRAALDSISKMLGLNAPEKSEVKHDFSSISDAELIAAAAGVIGGTGPEA